jgi:5-methylcytosine-specific restriction endonuclease McrA
MPFSRVDKEYTNRWKLLNPDRKKELDRLTNQRIQNDPIRLSKKREKEREYYRNRQKIDPGFANRKFIERYRNDEKFREKIKKYVSSYVKKNPAPKNVLNQNYRARRRNAEGKFTLSDWNSILESNEFRCVMCGSPDRLSIDHIIPLSKGGTNYPNNLQPLCRSCNSQKNNKIILKSVASVG